MRSDLTLVAARYLGPSVLVALGRTWRFRRIDATGAPYLERYGPRSVIYALWHAQQLPLTVQHRGENVAVMISQHRDGEIIARVVESIGYRAVRGSSTRGGSRALKELVRAASEGHPLAITTDGPRGPARVCKPGVVLAASLTGLPVVPTAAAAVRAWVFRSWDRFVVPKPGSVVYLTYGEPIHVPPELDESDVVRWQERISEAQNLASAVCEAAAREDRASRP